MGKVKHLVKIDTIKKELKNIKTNLRNSAKFEWQTKSFRRVSKCKDSLFRIS